jgi:hypothetical protein
VLDAAIRTGGVPQTHDCTSTGRCGTGWNIIIELLKGMLLLLVIAGTTGSTICSVEWWPCTCGDMP